MSMKQLTLFDCPLCGAHCETQNSLRVHLHVSHPKSLIIDAYLDVVGE